MNSLCTTTLKLNSSLDYLDEADGAHVDVDELEPGIGRANSNCADTLSCPAPMYWKNGEYTGVYSNIESLVPTVGDEDFGLDAVEPLFFHPLADWEGYGPFVTALNFDVEDFDQDIFYFCHVRLFRVVPCLYIIDKCKFSPTDTVFLMNRFMPE